MTATVIDNSTDNKPGFWRRYRLPIVLGIIAISLYVFSIIWIVYGNAGAS